MEPHAAAVEAINQQLGTNWDWHQLAMYLWVSKHYTFSFSLFVVGALS